MQRRQFIGTLTAIASARVCAQAPFPDKTLTILVPYSGGSSSDAQARLFAEHLSRILQQNVIVENRPGAGAAVGMRALKAAAADGYTIGMAGSSPMVINPFVTKDLPYTPDDFIHVHGISLAPAAFVVSADSPWETLPAAVAAVKAAQRPLYVGTYAAVHELATTALGILAGCQTQNVPYKGAANAIADLVGGHLEMGFFDVSGALPLITQGRLRVLAGTTQPAVLGQVPLVSDLYPGFEVRSWTTFIVRRETPTPVVQHLEAAFRQVHAHPTVQTYFENNGLIPMRLGHTQMQAYQAEETAHYQKLTGAAGIRPR